MFNNFSIVGGNIYEIIYYLVMKVRSVCLSIDYVLCGDHFTCQKITEKHHEE